MKCNIDTFFTNHDNEVGIGMCLRDGICAFVLTKTEWFQSICDMHIGNIIKLLLTLQNGFKR